MPLKKKKPDFKDCLDIIDGEIQKRRGKWNLKSLAWMDFDDVSQIIKLHLFNKWSLYDPEQTLGPWLNRIISNQLKNLVRNNYGNFTRPCLQCAAAQENEGCKIFKSQCSLCPLYLNWEKTKKNAHNLKMPLSVENHAYELKSISYDQENFTRNALKLHEKMKEKLKPLEWKIYNLIYIQNKSDNEVAKLMNYITSEEGRPPGYKQIKNIKKSIIEKVKRVLKKGEVDIL